ncbi:ATP-dependent DNA helicase [Inmirania thermothiophila]|uniref:DNA 5'-3' helicase n=1 Tax=Inmirania thermothiophila TaxID=1750597 RepID=A0A3N1Y1B0_9GAMM|nr:ATP-dependent DNA helicase [Inmirania thermothiophila]ROR32609.1 ATP-dependent DNA helicase DinG [Inmirania thermothiophila]
MAALFAPDGPLAGAVAGFAPRPGQVEMAEAVAAALHAGGTLLCEAGTGTGKTLAYLVPAVESGRRVLVSTGTRALQEQVFRHELPRVLRALGRGARVTLLKGRANYLCPHRAAVALAERHFLDREGAEALAAIEGWAARTREGDIAEVVGVAEDHPLWARVTSTADNCLGGDCPELGRCFVQQARRRAQQADLVVTNHHLVASDLALRREGVADLLPEVDGCIVDEAHQFPDVVAERLGQAVSGRQLAELARDARGEAVREAPGEGEVEAWAGRLEAQARAAAARLAGRGRMAWEDALATGFGEDLDALGETLRGLAAVLEAAADRGPGLARCSERARRLAGLVEGLLAPDEGDAVRWVETRAGFVCHRTPVAAGSVLAPLAAALAPAWVFTSATLTVDGGFAHFAGRLGLEDYEARIWPSPYDHARQALLCVPEGMPDPGRDPAGHTEAVVAVAQRVIEAAGGRTFVLFTSHRALRQAAARLQARVRHPVLVQGDGPRARLVERFRELGDAVLLGTSTFWEGVDVRGPALSAVVIDRLPFASPEDPLVQARARALARAGEDPFRALHLPRAVIALRQGVGRLVRDPADRGVLVICDPRLLTRGYGRVFLRSLPPMPRTRALAEVEAFLAREGA